MKFQAGDKVDFLGFKHPTKNIELKACNGELIECSKTVPPGCLKIREDDQALIFREDGTLYCHEHLGPMLFPAGAIEEAAKENQANFGRIARPSRELMEDWDAEAELFRKMRAGKYIDMTPHERARVRSLLEVAIGFIENYQKAYDEQDDWEVYRNQQTVGKITKPFHPSVVYLPEREQYMATCQEFDPTEVYCIQDTFAAALSGLQDIVEDEISRKTLKVAEKSSKQVYRIPTEPGMEDTMPPNDTESLPDAPGVKLKLGDLAELSEKVKEVLDGEEMTDEFKQQVIEGAQAELMAKKNKNKTTAHLAPPKAPKTKDPVERIMQAESLSEVGRLSSIFGQDAQKMRQLWRERNMPDEGEA